MTSHKPTISTHTAFICDRGDCRKGFENYPLLLLHQRVHDNNLFQCYFCPWSGFHDGSFRNHLNHHFDIRPFQCSYCDKKFFEASGKMKHEDIYHEKINDRYKCQFCDFKSYSGDIVRKHIRKCHQK